MTPMYPNTANPSKQNNGGESEVRGLWIREVQVGHNRSLHKHGRHCERFQMLHPVHRALKRSRRDLSD